MLVGCVFEGFGVWDFRHWLLQAGELPERRDACGVRSPLLPFGCIAALQLSDALGTMAGSNTNHNNNLLTLQPRLLTSENRFPDTSESLTLNPSVSTLSQ